MWALRSERRLRMSTLQGRETVIAPMMAAAITGLTLLAALSVPGPATLWADEVEATGSQASKDRKPDDNLRRRARKRDFDDHGEVQCAQERGQELGLCAASIVRGEGGNAALVVTFKNGFARTLYFVDGNFHSADATMSGVGTDTDLLIENDHQIIRVDDQRYAVPEDLILDN